MNTVIKDNGEFDKLLCRLIPMYYCSLHVDSTPPKALRGVACISNMLMSIVIFCGVFLVLYSVYRWTRHILTAMAWHDDSLIFANLQVCLCPLPSVEEMWYQRPHTRAFLWKLQKRGKNGKSHSGRKGFSYSLDWYCCYTDETKVLRIPPPEVWASCGVSTVKCD